MTSHGSTTSHPASGAGVSQLTSKKALDIARDTEGELESDVLACLHDVMAEICRKLDDYPDTYIFTKLEFAIFNYCRPRILSDNAQQAVDRFWRTTHATGQ